MSNFKKVTIKEVAEKAGVSISSVSRVINGNYPVSTEIRQKVVNAIKEMNYQPNEVARSLKSGRSKIIGVVIANMANRFFMHLAKGVETVVEPLNYNLIICSTYNNPEKEKKVLSMLTERMIDAIVLATSLDNKEPIENVIKKTPVVLVERRVEGIRADMVLEDNYSSAYRLMKHLVDNGHKKIAMVNGIERQIISKERFMGCKKALTEKGIEIDERYIIKGEFDKEEAYNGVYKMLKTLPREEWPTAIFSASGLMSESVIHAVRDAGLSIPDDISMVSYGELPSDLISPRITFIRQNASRMGEKAGELVLARLGEISNDDTIQHFKEILLDTEIVYGESVKRILSE